MNRKKQETPQVLVCQNGARRRYVIPRMLEEEGMLAGLYTDASSYSPMGRLAKLLLKCGLKHPPLGAIAARRPQGIPRRKIFTCDKGNILSMVRGHPAVDLSDTYIRWGLQKADVVYSMYGESLGFLRWARKQGARVIVDVFVHPSTNRIIAEEEKRFLGKAPDWEWIEVLDQHSRAVFETADALVCPSEWVAEGVREFMPECAERIHISPYGSSLSLCSSINTPEPGRILFAGRAPLRKGLHYLAEAAAMLRERGLEFELRAAGVERSDIEWMEHKDQVTCLGTVPMEEMKGEYALADVFVLPSLSEGQAGVLLEAMANGCPVVATRESGVDLNPDAGIRVPSGNPKALADALAKMLTDRRCRTQAAEGALKQAEMFTMESYKSRLTQLVDCVAAAEKRRN